MSCPRKSTYFMLLTKSRKPLVTHLIFLNSLKTVSLISLCILPPCILIVLDNEDWRFSYLLQQRTKELGSNSDPLPAALWWGPCLGAQKSLIVYWCQCRNVVTLQIALLSSHMSSLQRCSHPCWLVKMDGNLSFLRKGRNRKEKVLPWG